MGRLSELYRDADRFLREYTKGLKPRDVGRVFRREAVDAYRTLLDDHGEEARPGLWQQVKVAFLALSYQLSPGRRVLFALALLMGFLGFWDADLRIAFLPGLALDLWELLTPISLLLFVLLLGLELADRIRVRDELEIARDLQQDLLPSGTPPIPGFTVVHSYRTANTVGGDYYDFLPLPDGRWLLVAGDASGHGMAAGLLMVIAKTALEIAAASDSHPEAVARVVHGSLLGTGGNRGFMTLFCGRLDPRTGELEFVNAGHPFPFLRRVGGEILELGEGSLPLGLPREPRWAATSVQLHPGDMLLVYSDGMPETVHAVSRETYGYERLRAHLTRGGSPRAAHDRIQADYASFLGDESPTDDQSLLVIGRNPAEPRDQPE